MTSKTLKFLFMGLILLLIAGGIVIFIEKKIPAKEKIPTTIPTTTAPTTHVSTTTQPATSTEIQIDTSDWKTYRNEEYKFEISYPEEWSVNVIAPRYGAFFEIELMHLKINLLVRQPIWISICPNLDKYDFRTFARKSGKSQCGQAGLLSYIPEDDPMIREVQLKDGTKIIKFTAPTKWEVFNVAGITHETLIITLSAVYDSPEQARKDKMFDEILSTFRFIN